ncbi:hypothetical protein CI109_100378 [Kwoniella shandongensis]|uniref:Uncharacterized protein n=1 Tax=Kwoniella shandongensis TaxID=1734106 RepID=A0AAJ8LFK1_9TREE
MPLQNPLWEIIEPHLVSAGLYTVQDPTYGRWLLPPHPPHLSLINDPGVSHNYRRVFLPPYGSFKSKQEAYDSTQIIHAEDVKLVKEELETGVKHGGRWVCYSTWEMKDEPKGGWDGGGKGRGRDLVLIHGEMNSYIPSLLLLPAALHVVLTDVVQNDLARGREQRKVFLSGASMGGWTVLYYILKYPPTSSPEVVVSQAADPDATPPEEGAGKGYGDAERSRKGEKTRIHVAGAFVLCPMVEGSLPLAKAVRGNVSDDPKVEEDFFSDLMLKVGSDEADDEKRQRVLADWKSWLLQRC